MKHFKKLINLPLRSDIPDQLPFDHPYIQTAKTKTDFETDVLHALTNQDFPLLAKYLLINDKDGQEFFFNWNQWFPSQRDFWRMAMTLCVVLKGRQIGFTRFCLFLDLFYALSHPRSYTLILTHHWELAKKNIEIIKKIYHSLSDVAFEYGCGDLFPPFGKKASELSAQKTALHFANGATIEARTAGQTEASAANAGRGETINRLHATEMAFWQAPEATLDSVLKAIPKLPSSEVVFESTPKGSGNQFHRLCMDAMEGRNAYRFVFFEWWKHPEYRIFRKGPFIPQNDLEKKLQKEGIPDECCHFFRQEWSQDPSLDSKSAMLWNYPLDPYSCFQSSGDSALTSDEKDQLKSVIKTPLDCSISFKGIDLRAYELPIDGQRYVIGIDVASGRGRDASVAVVLNRWTCQIAGILSSNRIGVSEFALAVKELGEFYHNALLCPENNGIGDGLCDALAKTLKYRNIFQYQKKGDGKKMIGLHSNVNTRSKMTDLLLEMIAKQEITVMDRTLFNQLVLCEVDDNNSIQAIGKDTKDEARDDHVIAYAIALYAKFESKRDSRFSPMVGGRYGNSGPL